jgi:tetratricopeptide (TPR) repeat protein
VASLETLEAATDSGRALPRPWLPNGGDTNSAAAYYQRAAGMVRLGMMLDSAEMALYWASRLEPSWPEPIFARAMVILQALQRDVFETWRSTRSVGAMKRVRPSVRQMQLVDSLFRVAWARNPFLYSELEFAGMLGGRPRDAAAAAMSAYATRQFTRAESLFAVALHKHPGDVVLRIYRAKTLFLLQRYDNAVVELAEARDSVRHRAEAERSPLVPSVEMFEYAIGIAEVQQDDFPAARAAFQRALLENLGFYWAHTRLAGSALRLGDTATALLELDMALQLEGRDPILRFYDGVVRLQVRRSDEAAKEFERAIELDPYYAEPYLWLAKVAVARHDSGRAIEQYRSFLAHAAHQNAERPGAVSALAELEAAHPDSTR